MLLQSQEETSLGENSTTLSMEGEDISMTRETEPDWETDDEKRHSWPLGLIPHPATYR